MTKAAKHIQQDPRELFEDISRELQAGHMKAAEAKVEAALAEHPESVNFLHLGGLIKQNTGDIKLADKLLHAAYALRPDQPDIMHNLAVFLLATGRPQEALPFYEQLTGLVPNRAHLWANYGHALRQCGKLKEALKAFEEGYKLDAAHPGLEAVIAMTRRQLADWSASPLKQESVTANLGPVFLEDPYAHLKCVKQAAANIQPATTLELNERENKRIRIGYLSNDLHEHATSFLIAELFGLHNRDKFEVFVYAYGRESDAPITKRMKEGAEHWVNCAGQPPKAIAERIAADNIQILVDLKGYTQGALPDVLAAKPAPIIVSWLGYPGSMGLDAVDYILADEFIIPEKLADAYSEKIIRMPHSYQINDRSRALLAAKPRAQYGLPEKASVLCCFNQTYKITPEVFAVWMRILKAHADTVLWLYCPNDDAAENLKNEAEKAGIDAARLIFAGKLPQAEHMARYRQADLVLDTYPYGGHTTTSDALWVGAPVVACAGQSFASRVSGSLLHAVELGDLVTHSLSDYEKKITELLANPDQCQEYRQHLRSDREKLPLFNTPAFVKALEEAFTRAVQNETPENITVKI
jgi:predicted O-linked N-acetylglucosamine transferase (SPINDLY family)